MTLLPGLSPVVPGYWVTLEGDEAFVTTDDQGRITGISCVRDDTLNPKFLTKFTSARTTNAIAANEQLNLQDATHLTEASRERDKRDKYECGHPFHTSPNDGDRTWTATAKRRVVILCEAALWLRSGKTARRPANAFVRV